MWDERYAKPGFLFGTDPAGFLVDYQSWLKPGKRALAVADGEGRNSVFLAERGMEVTAFDSSEVAVEKARALAMAHEARINFRHADIRNWDWEAEPFDLVAAIFIQFAGPALRAEIFEGMQTALKPGGILMLHGYTPEQVELGTGGPPEADNMYTVPMLKSAFRNMKILRLEAYEREIDEGRGHSGRSALIDLIARKI